MKDRARALITATAQKLAGRVLAQEELENELFTLVLTCYAPDREVREMTLVRRTPAAGEVLPPEQRATWARGKTMYDAPDTPDTVRCRP